MKEKQLRIGFVGVGAMGQMAHLRNYLVLPGCHVAAIAELRENTGKAVVKRHNIPAYYRSAADMLKAEPLDALVASQPFTRHGVVLQEILKAGIPVFTEKPLASSVQVGEKIVELVQKSGTFIMLGYHKRSDPATMYAKKIIEELTESGRLGRMTYVRILMPAGDWVAAGFEGMVRMDDEALELESDAPPDDLSESGWESYVSFVNYYIHQVNLLRHLIGAPYKPTYADKAGVILAAEGENGVTGIIEMSPFQTSVDWQEEALVCFERGWIKIELPAPLALNRPGRVTVFSDPGDGKTPLREEPSLPWVHAMKQQAMNFLSAARGDAQPMTTAFEALEDLRVAREYIRLSSGM